MSYFPAIDRFLYRSGRRGSIFFSVLVVFATSYVLLSVSNIHFPRASSILSKLRLLRGTKKNDEAKKSSDTNTKSDTVDLREIDVDQWPKIDLFKFLAQNDVYLAYSYDTTEAIKIARDILDPQKCK